MQLPVKLHCSSYRPLWSPVSGPDIGTAKLRLLRAYVASYCCNPDKHVLASTRACVTQSPQTLTLSYLYLSKRCQLFLDKMAEHSKRCLRILFSPCNIDCKCTLYPGNSIEELGNSKLLENSWFTPSTSHTLKTINFLAI